MVRLRVMAATDASLAKLALLAEPNEVVVCAVATLPCSVMIQVKQDSDFNFPPIKRGKARVVAAAPLPKGLIPLSNLGSAARS